MCVAVIGGMERLERTYITESERLGIDLRVFNKAETKLARRISGVDAALIFTNKVSHRARQEAIKEAKRKNIPVLMCHSCGVCTLRDCLNGITDNKEVIETESN